MMTKSQRRRKWLLVFGAILFAYNASTILHECGHALVIVADGGEVERIVVSPLGWGHAQSVSGSPQISSWGGFFFASVIPVLVVFVLWIVRSRLTFLGLLLAAVGLFRSGYYMLDGALLKYGDAGRLIEKGVPPGLLIFLGITMLVLSVPFILPCASLIGIGRGRCSVFRTLQILGVPILAYELAIAAYLGSTSPWELLLSPLPHLAALPLAVCLLILLHFTAVWFKGPESRRRTTTGPLCTAILCASLGVAAFAAGPVFFTTRTLAEKERDELHSAAAKGDLEEVEWIIKSGCDPNAVRRGRTPLHWAILGKHSDVINFLIESGADVDLPDEKYAWTALHYAVRAEMTDLVRELLAEKARVHVKSAIGITPLHVAAWKGYKEIARLLLEAGADVNASDDKGRTPLLEARHYGNSELAQLLREHGGRYEADDPAQSTTAPATQPTTQVGGGR